MYWVTDVNVTCFMYSNLKARNYHQQFLLSLHALLQLSVLPWLQKVLTFKFYILSEILCHLNVCLFWDIKGYIYTLHDCVYQSWQWLNSIFSGYICKNNCSLNPFRYEYIGTRLVSREPGGQGQFCVTKYKRANYIALNVPYYYWFSFFCSDIGHKRDHILSHSLVAIHKIGIDRG